jgi:steroid 5-alpha reductase family enzyme
VLIEFFADQQQWNYHKAKSAYQSTAQVPKNSGYTAAQLDRGFNTSGLFAWSRHPNFAAEQAVWVALYQWCCCDSDTLGNWAAAGAMGYLILFQASTWFTELITSEKYPQYALYQQRVGKFLPKTKTVSMEESETRKEKEKAKKVRSEAVHVTGSYAKGKVKKR